MMMKPDFDKIANVIRGYLKGITGGETHRASLANSFADMLAIDNPRFRRDLFMQYCGVKPEVTSARPSPLSDPKGTALRAVYGTDDPPDYAPGTAFLGEPPRPVSRVVPVSELTRTLSLRAADYIPESPDKRTYPAARTRSKKRNNNYRPEETPDDTPALDTSFHDREMDV